MLIIQRKNNETVHIGKNVIIHVLHVKNGSVKLGFEAPQEVQIMRGKLVEEGQTHAQYRQLHKRGPRHAN